MLSFLFSIPISIPIRVGFAFYPYAIGLRLSPPFPSHLPIPAFLHSSFPFPIYPSPFRYIYPSILILILNHVLTDIDIHSSLSLFSEYVSLLSHWFFVHVLVLLLLYDATWIWVHVHDIFRKRLWTIVSVAQCGSDLQLVHTNLPNPFAKMLLLIPGPLPTVGSPCHALRYSLVHRISALLSSSSYPRYNLDNP